MMGEKAASNARVNISDSIPGNPERILSVQGGLDVVAKVSMISICWYKVLRLSLIPRRRM